MGFEFFKAKPKAEVSPEQRDDDNKRRAGLGAAALLAAIEPAVVHQIENPPIMPALHSEAPAPQAGSPVRVEVPKDLSQPVKVTLETQPTTNENPTHITLDEKPEVIELNEHPIYVEPTLR